MSLLIGPNVRSRLVKKGLFLLCSYILLLTLAACSTGNHDAHTIHEPSEIGEDEELRLPKLMVHTENNQQIEVAQGAGCWTVPINLFEKRGMCTDTVGLPELIMDIEPSVLEKGETLILAFEKEPTSYRVANWSRRHSDEVELDIDRFQVPSEPGVYIYDVYAQWKEGYSYYAFTIEVR